VDWRPKGAADMQFGTIPVSESKGCLLAHSLQLDGKRLKKGHRITAEDIAAMLAKGLGVVTAARLDQTDLVEDEAARRIADALCCEHIRAESAATGRVNLYATATGLFTANRTLVDAINRQDPGITLATLDNLLEVQEGRMVATVKIIPYAVPRAAVEQVVHAAVDPVIGVEPYSAKRVGVISTVLPQLKESVIAKTERNLAKRLALSGSAIVHSVRTDHDAHDIAKAIGAMKADCDLIVIFGASAICDIDDVIPAAIRERGGRIEHFGMPVDPGNLLLVGELNGKPVIGAPGCARSPAENGFDWVLQRLLAGRKVTAEEITGMGVGGLLMEIGTRPQPRESRQGEGRFSAVVLAAGQSRRMGSTNKLLAQLNGEPMVAHVAGQALGSAAGEVVVVTGHEAEKVESALAGLDVSLARNPQYAQGLSTSLAAGIGAVDPQASHAIVLLGDMPGITSQAIDSLITAAGEAPAGTIVVATTQGKRGNPVIWPRQYFDALTRIEGDVGARHLIGANEAMVRTVEIGEAAGFDIDTPEALEAAGGFLPR